MSKLLSAVACNLDAHLLSACYPLLEEERVEAIEWSFDALYDKGELPSWFEELLGVYSREKRLIGHGIFFSLFSGRWTSEQADWLTLLKQVSTKFPFDHVTEHFGFMTGKDFHSGAPLPIPYNSVTLGIGRDRLKRIQDAARCPVGLENLAFSYSASEVKRHGDFLQQLVEPVNGFIILDLHNAYCQLHNFSLAPAELLGLYPLHLVREIHISGGSWQASALDPTKNIRRDTHDSGVPAEVFELLNDVLDKCPHCKYVVLEQIGGSLEANENKQQFYNDFLRMQQIVNKHNASRSVEPINPFAPTFASTNFVHAVDDELEGQQRALAEILETSGNYADAIQALQNSILANSDWNVNEWHPEMLDTAMQIARKWKK